MTSDLKYYIYDGVNGFVINDKTSITDCYRKAISSKKETIHKMKQNSIDVAKSKLMVDIYAEDLERLFIN